MIGYIYLIIDLTNWKKYVGQHHYHLEKLDSNYHGSGHIIKMIYKKRPETLKEVYLKTCYTQEELDEWEKYFIFIFDTIYPNGYNLTEGGNGGVPCEETRRKMSLSAKGRTPYNKGKHLSEEHKKKIGESNKGLQSGEKNPFYGKHHSEETKRKISDNKINGKSSKKVLQFDLYGNFIREWPSTSEAQRSGCGYYSSGISLCCQGKQKTHKGFIWKYKD